MGVVGVWSPNPISSVGEDGENYVGAGFTTIFSVTPRYN